MIMDPPAGLWLARSRAKSHLIGSNCINQIKSDKNNINYMMDSRILEVELCLFFIFFQLKRKIVSIQNTNQWLNQKFLFPSLFPSWIFNRFLE